MVFHLLCIIIAFTCTCIYVYFLTVPTTGTVVKRNLTTQHLIARWQELFSLKFWSNTLYENLHGLVWRFLCCTLYFVLYVQTYNKSLDSDNNSWLNSLNTRIQKDVEFQAEVRVGTAPFSTCLFLSSFGSSTKREEKPQLWEMVKKQVVCSLKNS